jgi:hypothetical protein
MARYDDDLEMRVVYSPPRYPNTTAGAVRYVPIAVDGRVVLYLWAAEDGEATAVVYRTDTDVDALNLSSAWYARLRKCKEGGLTVLAAFDHVRQHGVEGCTVGEVRQAPSLDALFRIAGRDLEAERRRREAARRAWEAERAARSGSPDGPMNGFLQMQAALRANPEFPAPDPGRSQQIRMIDEVLRIKPVPKELWGWWATDAAAFGRDLAALPGTTFVEPGYLEVAMVRHPGLATAEVVVHVRVPVGTPGIYLNLFDETKRLQAPTMLLARGLTMAIHSAERHEGQWRLEAEIHPQPAAGPGVPPA